MPIRFTLARLMIYITLLAVACGLVVNFPDAMNIVLIGGCLAVPLVFLWLGLNAKYRLEMIKFAASFLGGMAGLRLGIFLLKTWHLRFDYDSRSIAGWIAIAAIIVACTFAPLGAALLIENYCQRYRSKSAEN